MAKNVELVNTAKVAELSALEVIVNGEVLSGIPSTNSYIATVKGIDIKFMFVSLAPIELEHVDVFSWIPAKGFTVWTIKHLDSIKNINAVYIDGEDIPILTKVRASSVFSYISAIIGIPEKRVDKIYIDIMIQRGHRKGTTKNSQPVTTTGTARF